VETRERQYPFRFKANRFKRPPRPGDPEGKKGRVRYRDDPGGSGREIVREVLICAACAAAAPADEDNARHFQRGPPLMLAA
jgi:hypothetical protein